MVSKNYYDFLVDTNGFMSMIFDCKVTGKQVTAQ
jgi:hypothetical protein